MECRQRSHNRQYGSCEKHVRIGLSDKIERGLCCRSRLGRYYSFPLCCCPYCYCRGCCLLPDIPYTQHQRTLFLEVVLNHRQGIADGERGLQFGLNVLQLFLLRPKQRCCSRQSSEGRGGNVDSPGKSVPVLRVACHTPDGAVGIIHRVAERSGVLGQFVYFPKQFLPLG